MLLSLSVHHRVDALFSADTSYIFLMDLCSRKVSNVLTSWLVNQRPRIQIILVCNHKILKIISCIDGAISQGESLFFWKKAFGTKAFPYVNCLGVIIHSYSDSIARNHHTHGKKKEPKLIVLPVWLKRNSIYYLKRECEREMQRRVD